MPWAPRRGKKKKRNQRQLSAHQRGYGADWRKLRERFKRHCIHVLLVPIACAKCGTRDNLELDHVRPFRDRHDPLRLDLNNLQWLCRHCHLRKPKNQTVRY